MNNIYYNFINQYGEIIEIDKLSNIKKGLTFEKLNLLKPLWAFSKSENDFFKKYGLYPSVFNVGCFQHLKMVYLFENDLIEKARKEFLKRYKEDILKGLTEEETLNKFKEIYEEMKEVLK